MMMTTPPANATPEQIASHLAFAAGNFERSEKVAAHVRGAEHLGTGRGSIARMMENDAIAWAETEAELFNRLYGA